MLQRAPVITVEAAHQAPVLKKLLHCHGEQNKVTLRFLCERGENEKAVPFVLTFRFERQRQSARQTSDTFDIGSLAYTTIRRKNFIFAPYHLNITTLRILQTS